MIFTSSFIQKTNQTKEKVSYNIFEREISQPWLRYTSQLFPLFENVITLLVFFIRPKCKKHDLPCFSKILFPVELVNCWHFAVIRQLSDFRGGGGGWSFRQLSISISILFSINHTKDKKTNNDDNIKTITFFSMDVTTQLKNNLRHYDFNQVFSDTSS